MASIDRLSSLPDDVKCHILSFLPTKLSVATSVLEKRWRFVWAHVPCLDFSGGDFRKKGTQTSEDFLLEETWLEETQDSDDLREEEGTQASDIIHSIILRHNTNRMDTLKLCYIKCNEYQLDIWIRTAIERSIRNLYLELDFDTLSLYLFNCKTIVDLTLRISRVSISAVDNVSLPSLKKFYVYNLICENDDVLPRFLSGCPSLEELILKFTFVEDNYVGCIKDDNKCPGPQVSRSGWL
ncbi:Putative F-box/LRR-repeat protein [Striga hermonthica]|uniref:F-box/LRR-repeat protein n=1 Tax=Striga hermonthica TaxID=68872 RepID=A0A9N7MK90_STRHE|nr:Putative F-box/LRR-repeat protein [Striga hermonthica]